jgi:putative transposase
MEPFSYARHQFPPAVIQQARRLYLRSTLSFRDVEDLLDERRPELSYGSIQRWFLKFGAANARNMRRSRPRPGPRWHLTRLR